MRVARGTRRQRGGVAMMVAMFLPLLLAVLALVIDLGHFWQVREQMQNAADAAALAGVRDLDGQALMFPVARFSAQSYAALHQANQTQVQLDLNLGNAATGDIVLGNWDFTGRVFTPADSSMSSALVNAVKVHVQRTATEGGAVQTWFAQIFGFTSENLTATAIAAGGGPRGSCGFPLAVPACSLVDGNGNLRCNSTLTFGQATTDNVGFTLMLPAAPVSTPQINCALINAVGQGCGKGCACATWCSNNTNVGSQIYISNGNNLSQQVVDAINAAVQLAGAGGLEADVPVLDSGSLTSASCGSFQFNRAQTVDGYVKMHILGATSQPNRSIQASIDCTKTTSETAGGGFYGYVSTTPYLVQ